jgi:hypothetical protein
MLSDVVRYCEPCAAVKVYFCSEKRCARTCTAPLINYKQTDRGDMWRINTVAAPSHVCSTYSRGWQRAAIEMQAARTASRTSSRAMYIHYKENTLVHQCCLTHCPVLLLQCCVCHCCLPHWRLCAECMEGNATTAAAAAAFIAGARNGHHAGLKLKLVYNIELALSLLQAEAIAAAD